MTTHSVLCLSRSPQLNQVRGWLLGKYYQVSEIETIEELIAFSQQNSPALLVLCHSLKANECSRAIQFSRANWPEIRVVSVAAAFSCCSPEESDRVVVGSDGPDALLAAAADLLEQCGS